MMKMKGKKKTVLLSFELEMASTTNDASLKNSAAPSSSPASSSPTRAEDVAKDAVGVEGEKTKAIGKRNERVFSVSIPRRRKEKKNFDLNLPSSPRKNQPTDNSVPRLARRGLRRGLYLAVERPRGPRRADAR